LNGFEKKKKCINQLLIARNGPVTEQEVLDDYLANWNPTTAGDTPREEKKRIRDIRGLLKVMIKDFIPRSDHRLYPFMRGQFSEAVQKVKVDVDDFNPKGKRREKIDNQRLSDFISMKIGDAFYQPSTSKYFGQTSRNTSIDNSRALKKKKKIDWVLTRNTYKRLLDIAVKYQLLEVFEQHTAPSMGIRLVKGHARLIGPGKALVQVRDEWMPLYNEWKANNRSFRSMAA
jgi:hypothetical protein